MIIIISLSVSRFLSLDLYIVLQSHSYVFYYNSDSCLIDVSGGFVLLIGAYYCMSLSNVIRDA